MTLRAPMIVIDDVGSYNPLSPNQLVRPSYPTGGKAVLRRLERGHLVRIDSVRWVNSIDQANVVALGSTIEHGSSPTIQFEYRWGDSRNIHRAPWEDPAIPEKRLLEWGGTMKEQYGEQDATDRPLPAALFR